MYSYDVQILEDVLQFRAYDESNMIGILQVMPQPEQYVIEGIYVEPEYRNEGIATNLLDIFLDGIPRLKFLPCTCTFSEEDAEENLVNFFRNREDFFLIEAGKSMYVRNRELLIHPVISKILAKKTNPHIKALKELNPNQQKQLLDELKVVYLDTVSDPKELTTYYNPELSSVYVNEDGIAAAILVSDVTDENAFVETVYFKDKGVAGMEVAADVVRKIAELDDEMTLSFFAINEESEKLLDNLLENAWSVDKYTTYLANWTTITR